MFNKLFLSFITIFFLFIAIDCNEDTNAEEIENSENWDEISAEVCKKNHSADVKKQLIKCDEQDPFYKLDNYFKKCEQLKAHPGSDFYDNEKGECKYFECYEKLSQTKEFLKLDEEVTKMDVNARVEKGLARYNCIRKAFGLKIEEKKVKN